MSFSARFLNLIHTCELSQKEIARALDISEGSVINYKRGRIPKADELLRIANLFNVSMEWLLTGDNPKKEENQTHQDSSLIYKAKTKRKRHIIINLQFSEEEWENIQKYKTINPSEIIESLAEELLISHIENNIPNNQNFL